MAILAASIISVVYFCKQETDTQIHEVNKEKNPR